MCLQQYCLLQACGLIFVAGAPLQIEEQAENDEEKDDTEAPQQETGDTLEDLAEQVKALRKEVKRRPAAKAELQDMEAKVKQQKAEHDAKKNREQDEQDAKTKALALKKQEKQFSRKMIMTNEALQSCKTQVAFYIGYCCLISAYGKILLPKTGI